MSRYIVHDVYGYSNGNVRHIATFAYARLADAEQLARETHAGYVVRNHVETRAAPLPRVDHNKPDKAPSVPNPADVAKMKEEIVSEILTPERLAELEYARTCRRFRTFATG